MLIFGHSEVLWVLAKALFLPSNFDISAAWLLEFVLFLWQKLRALNCFGGVGNSHCAIDRTATASSATLSVINIFPWLAVQLFVLRGILACHEIIRFIYRSQRPSSKILIFQHHMLIFLAGLAQGTIRFRNAPMQCVSKFLDSSA